MRYRLTHIPRNSKWAAPTPTPSPAHGLQKEVHFIIMDVPVSMHWYTHIKINKNITQHLYERLKRVHLKKR